MQMLARTMLPAFPNLKAIELTDKADVESYTRQYPAHSAFNFTNLWAWDTTSRRKIADLHGNLVVLLYDYETGEPFFAFLGTRMVKETIHTLLESAAALHVSPTLRFVTDDSLRELRSFPLEVQEDHANHDYLYAVGTLAALGGRRLRNKRRLAETFYQTYSDVSFDVRDMSNPGVQEKLEAVLLRWQHNKRAAAKICTPALEAQAMARVMNTAAQHTLILSTVTVAGEVVGFGIDELVHDTYAISHFVKADQSYKGVYEFLNRQIARHLTQHGVTLWNWQQDLGIEGLRQSKQSYRPAALLRRYSVSYEKSSCAELVQKGNVSTRV